MYKSLRKNGKRMNDEDHCFIEVLQTLLEFIVELSEVMSHGFLCTTRKLTVRTLAEAEESKVIKAKRRSHVRPVT